MRYFQSAISFILGIIVQNGSKKTLVGLLHTEMLSLQLKGKSALRDTFPMRKLEEVSMWSMPLSLCA